MPTNEFSPAATSPAPATTPSKRKPRQRKLPIAPVKSIVPFDLREQKIAPIFKYKLAYFLSLDRDEFKQDSKLMQSKMCASDFVAMRLIFEAMRGEPWAVRELIDRTDGAWNAKPDAAEANRNTVIAVCYEQELTQKQRFEREALQRLIASVPSALRPYAERLLPKRKPEEERFTMEPPKQLQTGGEIEYIEPTPGSAE